METPIIIVSNQRSKLLQNVIDAEILEKKATHAHSEAEEHGSSEDEERAFEALCDARVALDEAYEAFDALQDKENTPVTVALKPRIKSTIEHNGKRKVCRIFDNGGANFFRYMVALKSTKHSRHGIVYPFLLSTDTPFDKNRQGGELLSSQFITGKHLGKRIAFDSLPVDVQKFILNNI